MSTVSLNHELRFKWPVLTLHLFYFGALLFDYVNYLAVIYGDLGFKDELNPIKVFYSLPLIAGAFLLSPDNGKPSYFFLHIFIALVLIPCLVMFSGADLPYSFALVTWAAGAVIALVSQFVVFKRLRFVRLQLDMLLSFLLLLTLAFIASLFAFGGMKYLNFDLSLVYDFREDAAAQLPPIYGYPTSTFGHAIIPIGIVCSLVRGRWLVLALFAFCSVMLFGLTSHKAPLFIPIIIIAVYWLAGFRNNVKYFLWALVIITIIGAVDFSMMIAEVSVLSGWVGALTVYRMMMVPASLNWGYFDFFTHHQHIYWAESSFSMGFLKTPYDVNLPLLIGREFLGLPEAHANTGFVGSGMAQAGYFGVMLYALLIGLLLSFLNAYAKTLGNRVVIAFFVFPVTTALQSADLPTMLLTQGLLPMLLILAVLPRLESARVGSQ